MKKISALLFVILIASLVLTACGTQPADPTPSIKLVPCPKGSKLTGNCIVKQDPPDILTDGEVENIGMVDYRYVEIVSPKGTFLRASILPESVAATGGGTNSMTLFLPEGKGVQTVQITFSCDTNSNGVAITIKHYKPFE